MRFPCAFVTLSFAALACAGGTLAGCGGSSSGDKPTTPTRSALVGVALRASDQKPVAQTVVTARHYVCDASDNCNFTEGTSDAPRVTADKNGHFVFPLAPGRYFVVFTAPKADCTGYEDGKFADVTADAATDISAQMTETSTCPN